MNLNLEDILERCISNKNKKKYVFYDEYCIVRITIININIRFFLNAHFIYFR